MGICYKIPMSGAEKSIDDHIENIPVSTDLALKRTEEFYDDREFGRVDVHSEVEHIPKHGDDIHDVVVAFNGGPWVPGDPVINVLESGVDNVLIAVKNQIWLEVQRSASIRLPESLGHAIDDQSEHNAQALDVLD